MEYIGEVFSRAEYVGKELSGAIFEDCLFENCKIQDLTLQSCRFTGCRFSGCRISELHPKGVEAMDNRFEDCSLLGIDWAELVDAKKREMGFLPFEAILNSALRHCVFFGMDLKKQDFSGCDFTGSYFEDCCLLEANFQNALLKGTVFSHNDMRKADFRGAAEYLFSLENNRAAKARFSLPEAVNLLLAMGIVIGDEETT